MSRVLYLQSLPSKGVRGAFLGAILAATGCSGATSPGNTTSSGDVPECGDGIVQDGEQCDDGNRDDTDACLSTCLNARCGDGHVQTGVEACDDGNLDDTDYCLSDCTLATCGDGHLQVGVEACDDANDIDTDDCLSDCQRPSCGDGYVWWGHEECDDGDPLNTNDCLDTCVNATCGDGVVWAGHEECDDGNAINGDGCDKNCRVTGCNNGIQTAGEACDDGNDDDSDDCLHDCEVSPSLYEPPPPPIGLECTCAIQWFVNTGIDPTQATCPSGSITKTVDLADCADVRGGVLIVNWASNSISVFNKVAYIAGDVEIDQANSDLYSVEFPELKVITGYLVAYESGSGTLSFSAPNLESAGSIFFPQTNPAPLVALDLSGLERVAGDLLLATEGMVNALSFISLPSLVSVGGNFTVPVVGGGWDNTLATVRAERLAYVGGSIALDSASPTLFAPELYYFGGSISVTGTDLSLPALREAAGLSLDSIPADGLDLPSLRRVDGDLTVQATSLTSLATLGNVEEVAGAMTVADNVALANLGLSNLTIVGGDYSVTNNSILPTCQAEALAAQATVQGATSITGNDDGGTCL